MTAHQKASTSFSRKKANEQALATHIRREHILIRELISDTRRKHTAEARDADQGKYTLLDKRIREETEKFQQLALNRRAKMAGTIQNG